MDNEVDMKRIGQKLRELRGIRTATGVAKAVGISTSALLAYETGERTPRDEVKMALCSYYGVTVGEVFFPDETGE